MEQSLLANALFFKSRKDKMNWFHCLFFHSKLFFINIHHLSIISYSSSIIYSNCKCYIRTSNGIKSISKAQNNICSTSSICIMLLFFGTSSDASICGGNYAEIFGKIFCKIMLNIVQYFQDFL